MIEKNDAIKIRIYIYILLYLLNQLYSTKIKKGDMENTQIQHQSSYKTSHLILIHATYIFHMFTQDMGFW